MKNNCSIYFFFITRYHKLYNTLTTRNINIYIYYRCVFEHKFTFKKDQLLIISIVLKHE